MNWGHIEQGFGKAQGPSERCEEQHTVSEVASYRSSSERRLESMSGLSVEKLGLHLLGGLCAIGIS